eukprot:GHVQ01039227.1.p1 GENE.GHVQ01039227.1~~GHVQ01039227.1.p1  ORF type:complete len:237 (+),score=27.29 GHVQ01039227.1:872-1582(+)
MCGSSDVLTALGIGAANQSVDRLANSLNACGICLCFSPAFLPGIGHLRQLRRSLGVGTLFNLLGPLLNYGSCSHRLIGVADKKLLPLFGHVIKQCPFTKRALVFTTDGMDELSPAGVAEVLEVTEDKQLKTWLLDPKDYGMKLCTVDDLKGGSPMENARILESVLDGSNQGPIADALAINAGAAVWLCGQIGSLKEAIQECLLCLHSGRAKGVLHKWRAFTPSQATDQDHAKDMSV